MKGELSMTLNLSAVTSLLYRTDGNNLTVSSKFLAATDASPPLSIPECNQPRVDYSDGKGGRSVVRTEN